MNDGEIIRDALLKSWDIILNGVSKDDNTLTFDEGEWKIESRSKLKSLSIAINQKEKPLDAVLHLVKFAEYMLPRSNLKATLMSFLSAVTELRQKYEKDPSALKDVVSYMIGYMNWSLDAVRNVLNTAGSNPEKARDALDVMLKAELGVVNVDEKEIKRILDEVMNWVNAPHNRGRRGR